MSNKKILGISMAGIAIILLAVAAVLLSGKIPLQSIIGGTGGDVGIKGEMVDTVAYGEPFAVNVWIQNTSAGNFVTSGVGVRSYTILYQPQCAIASIDGVRSLVQIQEATDTGRSVSDIPVLVNGVASYTGGNCKTQLLGIVGGIGELNMLTWGPSDALPYPINKRMMKITVGGYAPPGEHDLVVAFPCTVATVSCNAQGYCEYLTTQDIVNSHPAGMCGFSRKFTINPPTNVSIATTVQTVSNITGETITTTYLLTNGSTIEQTTSNSTIAVVMAAPVVGDISNITTVTPFETITTVIATSAAIPIVTMPPPITAGMAVGITSSTLILGGLAAIIIALAYFSRKRWLK